MLSCNSHDGNLIFMNNSIGQAHKLRMKKVQGEIKDVRGKIDVINATMKTVKEVSLDAYSDQFELMKRTIDEEISGRDQAIEDAVSELRQRYEATVASQRKRMAELDCELSEAQMKSIMDSEKQREEKEGRMNTIEAKNQQEIAELQGEINRVNLYLNKVQGEWNSLKDSTQRIYRHKLQELDHEQKQAMLRYSAILEQIERDNTPRKEGKIL